jgi:hypothetical protein
MFTNEFKNEIRRKATFVGGMFAGALALWGLCASIYAVKGSQRFGVDWMDEDEAITTEKKEEEE